VLSDRLMSIESYIVKAMKEHQEMTHSTLVNEVLLALKLQLTV